MIRVFVIEDNPTAILSGLKSMFRIERDGIQITGFAGSVKEMIEHTDSKAFDLLLMDLILRTSDPMENIRKIRKKYPLKPVVIYTQNASEDWMSIMRKEGARAFVTKNASREELKNIIERSVSDEDSFSVICSFSDHKNPYLGAKKEQSVLEGIERDIVLEILNSKSRSTIAKQFNLSSWEIRRRINRIRLRLNANSDYDMIKILTEKGEI